MASWGNILGTLFAVGGAAQSTAEIRAHNRAMAADQSLSVTALQSSLRQLRSQEQEARKRSAVDKFNILRDYLRDRASLLASAGGGGKTLTRAISTLKVRKNIDEGMINQGLEFSLEDIQFKKDFARIEANNRYSAAAGQMISGGLAGFQIGVSALEGFVAGRSLARELGLRKVGAKVNVEEPTNGQ